MNWSDWREDVCQQDLFGGDDDCPPLAPLEPQAPTQSVSATITAIVHLATLERVQRACRPLRPKPEPVTVNLLKKGRKK